MSSIFENNIKYLRKSINYSQTNFGKIFKKSPTTISDYENGKAEPNISTLLLLQGAFGIHVGHILSSDLSKIFTKSDILKKYNAVKTEKNVTLGGADVNLNVNPSVNLNQKSKENTGTLTQMQIGALKGILNTENQKSSQEINPDCQKQLQILQHTIQSQQATINNLNLLIQKLST